jgi:hypothetical protein
VSPRRFLTMGGGKQGAGGAGAHRLASIPPPQSRVGRFGGGRAHRQRVQCARRRPGGPAASAVEGRRCPCTRSFAGRRFVGGVLDHARRHPACLLKGRVEAIPGGVGCQGLSGWVDPQMTGRESATRLEHSGAQIAPTGSKNEIFAKWEIMLAIARAAGQTEPPQVEPNGTNATSLGPIAFSSRAGLSSGCPAVMKGCRAPTIALSSRAPRRRRRGDHRPDSPRRLSREPCHLPRHRP